MAMASTSGTDSFFWCYACSRLQMPLAQAAGAPVTGCTGCGAAGAALEGVVDVMDAGAFVRACHPEAALRAAAAAPLLPTFTVQEAGRDCAVCLDELAPGAPGAVATPCGHAFHAPCVAPWIQARGTCPLCRAPVGGATDRDGLVACRLSGGRIGLGRRVAGRVYKVRMLGGDGRLVRARWFEGAARLLRAKMALGALFRRSRVAVDVSDV